MKYVIYTLASAALVFTATAGRADNDIPTGALNEMGLSGLTVMSDSEAMQVRGAGAFAGGISWATIGGESAGTINVYGGRGRYEASGAGGSSAGRFEIRIREVENSDGTESEVTRVRITGVFAGGYSRAKAF